MPRHCCSYARKNNVTLYKQICRREKPKTVPKIVLLTPAKAGYSLAEGDTVTLDPSSNYLSGGASSEAYVTGKASWPIRLCCRDIIAVSFIA